MNAIIGYTYEADYHCAEHTERRFPGATDWRREGYDPADYTDSEGNEVHTVFGGDEWWEPSEGCQVLSCSECLSHNHGVSTTDFMLDAELDRVHSEDCVENFGEEPCAIQD